MPNSEVGQVLPALHDTCAAGWHRLPNVGWHACRFRQACAFFFGCSLTIWNGLPPGATDDLSGGVAWLGNVWVACLQVSASMCFLAFRVEGSP